MYKRRSAHVVMQMLQDDGVIAEGVEALWLTPWGLLGQKKNWVHWLLAVLFSDLAMTKLLTPRMLPACAVVATAVCTCLVHK